MDEQHAGAEGNDLSAFELRDFGTLTVMNARGDEPLLVDRKPVTIEVWGPGSDQAVAAERAAGLAQQRRLGDIMRGKQDPKAPQKAEREQIAKLVARTKAINNFPMARNAEAIYSNPKLNYITRQVIRFMDDDANFSPASSEN